MLKYVNTLHFNFIRHHYSGESVICSSLGFMKQAAEPPMLNGDSHAIVQYKLVPLQNDLSFHEQEFLIPVGGCLQCAVPKALIHPLYFITSESSKG